MLVLVDPFAVALEEDLKSRPSLTPEFDGVTLDDVSIHRLFQKKGQGCSLAMLQCFTSGTLMKKNKKGKSNGNQTD